MEKFDQASHAPNTDVDREDISHELIEAARELMTLEREASGISVDPKARLRHDELPENLRRYSERNDRFSIQMRKLTQEDAPTASRLVDTLMVSTDPTDRIAAARVLFEYQVGRMYAAPDEVRADLGRWQQLLNDPDGGCREVALDHAWSLAYICYEGATDPLYHFLREYQSTGSPF